ncbi:MAG: glycosyltransferase family 4 protein [Bacteroidetes bacterium]|nr:glycosyltransferase family 4 protein [Bacteroidota bacterium]
MKVAILTDYFPPYNGGVAHSVFRIAKGLSDFTDNIIVIAVSKYDKENRFPKVVKEHLNNLTVYRLYCTKNIPLNDSEDRRVGYYLLLEVLKQEKIWLIHAFYTFSSGYWAYLINKSQGIPYLLSVRGNDLTKNFFDIRITTLLTEIMINAKKILVVNNYIRKFILIHYPALIIKTEIVYNSIDGDEFLSQVEDVKIRNLYFEPDDFIFSFIGVIKEKKGVQMLIDAFNSISSKYNHAKLMLTGEIYDVLYEEITEYIAQNKNIVYFNKVDHDQVSKFFFASDAFIIPSFDDGLPNAMLEAIASKVPIIASNIFDDVFVDKEDALLFNPFNRSELFDCMELLINSPEKGKSFSNMALKLLDDKFSVATEIQSFFNIYCNEE